MLLLRRVLLIAVLALGFSSAHAFSLLGQKTPWHVLRLGYADAQIGGPVNLGEEHRWNVPIIYYSFSPEFLSFFGARGQDEIEKAIKMINDLPQMSDVNILDYPLNTSRVNYRAQALGLLDLKSVSLQLILEELGLGDPTQYVFTLRKRWTTSTDPPQTNYFVIKRNFDPVTYEPSSYINGELWTYTGISDGPESSITLTRPASPLARNFPVAGGFVPTGNFYTGLTRDDVGGLKYIYNLYNVNIENASSNAFSLVGAGGTVSYAGIANIGSAWSSPSFGTNTVDQGGTGTDPGTGTGTGGGTTGTNVFVNTSLRPGINKIQFQRIDYDGLLGVWISTNYAFVDQYLQRGQIRRQTLGRPMPVADLTFHAADLGQGPTDELTGFTSIVRTDGFQSNAALNGVIVGGGGGSINEEAGPGTVNPGISVTFSTVVPYFINGPYPSSLSEATSSRSFAWGSFDGSTNVPVVYPSGASIAELEQRVYGR